MRVLFVLAIAALLGGCVSAPTASVPTPVQKVASSVLSFLPAVTVDGARIASEPSIKVAKDGTIFVSAPTGSVKYATRPTDLATEADKGAFQSAIWRSKDNGSTWEFLSKGPAPYHSLLPGAGDSDLAIDAGGRVYMADQLGLATEVVSVSDDNGATWQEATPMGSGEPNVDRMWLWPDPAEKGTVYMNFDHNQVGIDVAKTTDGGMTWSAVQGAPESNSPGPIVATKDVVAFGYVGNGGIMFAHSEDKGATWKQDVVSKGEKNTERFPETFADSAGNLYVAWIESIDSGSAILYAHSEDAGKTWSKPVTAFEQPGRAIFLWGAAGAPGRIGFTWYGAPDPKKEYYEESAIVLNATSVAPVVSHARVSGTPARADPPCENGTGCTSGRELGDFQMCAIGPDGKLLAAYVTVTGADQQGHVTFAKLAQGPALFDAPPATWVV